MPRALGKMESPEKPKGRESVPGSGKERPVKKERKDPYAKMSYEEAFQAFDEASVKHRQAQEEVKKLHKDLVSSKGKKAQSSAKHLLFVARERVEEAAEDVEKLRATALGKLDVETLPGAKSKLSAEDALKKFMQAEDEYREANESFRALREKIFKSGKEPTKADRGKLREAELAFLRAEEHMEELQLIAKTKHQLESLHRPATEVGEAEHAELQQDLDFLEEGLARSDIEIDLDYLESGLKERDIEIDIDVSEFDVIEDPDTSMRVLKGKEAEEVYKQALSGYDQKIAEIEVSLDDMRESGGSDVEIQEQVQELAELKEERSELEKEMREGAGTKIAKGFEAALAEAKKDEALKSVAEEYTKLQAGKKKLETQIKQVSGHSADDIFENPSLAGGVMKRLGDRVRGFFSGLAGMEAEPTTDDLMREWKAVNKRMEELALHIQPPVATFEQKIKAKAIPTRPKDPEDDRQVRILEAKQAAEYLAQAELLMSDVKSELLEIELYDDTARFIEHEDMHHENAEALKERLGILQSHESDSGEFKKQLKELEDYFETYERRLAAKRDEVAEFAKEAKSAGKGKRVMSKVMGRAFGVAQPKSTYGTETMKKGHRKVEHLEKQGSKTELSPGPDQYAEEIQAYRDKKASEIRVVMQEYEPAAKLWEEMNALLEKEVDPDQYEKLFKLFGTRDLATAYVLESAFASMDGDKKAAKKIMEANSVLGLPETSNIDKQVKLEVKAAKKSSRKKKKAKSKTTKKKKAA